MLQPAVRKPASTETAVPSNERGMDSVLRADPRALPAHAASVAGRGRGSQAQAESWLIARVARQTVTGSAPREPARFVERIEHEHESAFGGTVGRTDGWCDGETLAVRVKVVPGTEGVDRCAG